MDYRIIFASQLINELDVTSLLDIGCRKCDLKKYLSNTISYSGNDLFQSDASCVEYVGNILNISIQRKFECVTALDVIEHVDNPYILMDKIFDLSTRYVVASLPNIFSFTHKIDFVFNNTLGNKYKFNTSVGEDRHRWLMNCNEIERFFKHFGDKHNCELSLHRLTIDQSCTNILPRLRIKAFKPFVSHDLMTRTILAVYRKKHDK